MNITLILQCYLLIGVECRLKRSRQCLTLSLIYVDPKDQILLLIGKFGNCAPESGDFENSIVNI